MGLNCRLSFQLLILWPECRMYSVFNAYAWITWMSSVDIYYYACSSYFWMSFNKKKQQQHRYQGVKRGNSCILLWMSGKTLIRQKNSQSQIKKWDKSEMSVNLAMIKQFQLIFGSNTLEEFHCHKEWTDAVILECKYIWKIGWRSFKNSQVKVK